MDLNLIRYCNPITNSLIKILHPPLRIRDKISGISYFLRISNYHTINDLTEDLIHKKPLSSVTSCAIKLIRILSLYLRLITKRDTEDMSTAFNATSSRSLPGVDIRNSGSQL
jgi:hypothetical protein